MRVNKIETIESITNLIVTIQINSTPEKRNKMSDLHSRVKIECQNHFKRCFSLVLPEDWLNQCIEFFLNEFPVCDEIFFCKVKTNRVLIILFHTFQSHSEQESGRLQRARFYSTA